MVNDIKNMKRKQKVVTPSQILTETIREEKNVDFKKKINQIGTENKKVERKRVSFDLRTDLHKELKLQALMQDKRIYILVEEALEKYLNENRK